MTITRALSDSYDFPYLAISGASRFPVSQKVTYLGATIGSKVENWREKIRDGSNATSAYYADRYKVVRQIPGSLSASFVFLANPKTTFAESFTGYLGTPGNLQHLFTSMVNAEAIAKGKFFNKLQQELSHVAGPSIIAEGLDTIRMFTHPVEGVMKLIEKRKRDISKIKRGIPNPKGQAARRVLDASLDSYLEFVWGLRPLMSDTFDIAEAFARWEAEVTGQTVPRAKIVTRGSEFLATNSVQNTGISNTGFAIQKVTKTETVSRSQFVAGLKADHLAAFGSNKRLIQLLGFDYGNWIPGLYEAMPWSWLIDYFTNIGTIINAGVTSTAGVTWIAKTNTSFTLKSIVNNHLVSKTPSGYGAGWKGQASGGHAGTLSLSRKTMQRVDVPIQSMGVPSLVIKHPFDDMQKISNLIAVFVPRLKD